ncbi:MAG TPA: 50S ribosomal protein L15 [Actinomycetota bacterium]|nr:50S ribosomal protein L15 [Actinomycetota bacterium]
MKLHHLRPGDGAKRPRRRVGRGRAGRRGKTAGRGTKGYLARHNSRIGFEGGQMPIQRRTPKLKGFTNPNREEWAVVNVERLAQVFEARTTVTPELLRERGLVRKALPVKILGNGELDKPLSVSAHAVSDAARGKIEGAGGRVEILPSPLD